jgi:predicted anti-sigma-YlaC factor YlaD
MNCTQTRSKLPIALLETLPAGEQAALDEHLATCPGCRLERSALAKVLRRLDAVPAADVRVDLARIYDAADRRRQTSLRRWRRAALLLLGAAASLALVFVRWSQPVAASPVPPPAPSAMERSLAPMPTPEVTAADLRLLKDVVYTLAAVVDERDIKVQQTLVTLGQQLEQVEDQARQRWVATERYVSALHTAQMDARMKGEK